jgi:hypothetical protein
MKKGDDVADDEDDDAVRTSVSQDRVTVPLCTEELFIRTQNIWLSPHIRQVKCGRGEDTDSQHCSLSLWRVVRGSKLTHLVSLIHGLFIT